MNKFEFSANRAFQKRTMNTFPTPSPTGDDYFITGKKKVTSAQGSRVKENDPGLLCSSEISETRLGKTAMFKLLRPETRVTFPSSFQRWYEQQKGGLSPGAQLSPLRAAQHPTLRTRNANHRSRRSARQRAWCGTTQPRAATARPGAELSRFRPPPTAQRTDPPAPSL